MLDLIDMKKISFLIILFLVSLGIRAQISVKEDSFKEVGQFFTMKEDMTDDNYTPYAVIRIKTENMGADELQKLDFKGDARTFIEVEPQENEVWVYLTYLATYLKITHPDLSSTEFIIPYDMEPLHGYELVLVSGAAYASAGKGSLSVTTVPDGAKLEINGVAMSPTPYNNAWMASGQYEIKVSKPNYQPVTRIVNIADKEDVKVEIVLEHSFGYLNINTQPTGATVFIDGVEKGVSPLIIGDMRIGQHDIKLVKDKYAIYENTVEVKDEGETLVTIPMAINQDVKVFNVKGVTFEMMEVAGGTYTMGATGELLKYAEENQTPAHLVTVSSFYIGKCEVTDSLWCAVMGNKKTRLENIAQSNITWDEVQKFIEKLNKITKCKFRLPTEAEWQFAARGGIYSKGYGLSGSNKIGEVAWFADNSAPYLPHKPKDEKERKLYLDVYCKIHEVATKNPNELNLYDMSGNVWEYCSDYYGIYKDEEQINPKGPVMGFYHLIVGGGFRDAGKDCLVTSRRAVEPSVKDATIGFRLALDQ